jgi:RNA polymerase sigma-70 factor, ECF subfamily
MPLDDPHDRLGRRCGLSQVAPSWSLRAETITMMQDPSTHPAMLAAIPHLRTFAISLCRDPEYADDLVQDTLLRACDKIARFEPGTNMTAWLITILRHQFYAEYRRRRREIADVDGIYADTLVTHPAQLACSEYGELRRALDKLPDEMRDAIVLIAGSGESYDEAARICGCAVGTIKSRVHRARTRLAELLSVTNPADLAEDAVGQSVVTRAERDRIHAV